MRTKTLVETLLEGETCWMTEWKCPKCGSSINTNGEYLWCSHIGCDFGLDRFVKVEELMLD